MSWLSWIPGVQAEDEADRRFYELVNTHIHAWVALAREVARDAHHAEDALAEALSALAQSLSSDKPPRDPMAWMATTIANRAHERIRRETSQRRIVARLSRMAPDPSSTPPEHFAELRENRLRRIADLLPHLAKRQREVVTLHLEEGLSHREIAERLDCAESTIRMTYKNAMRQLRGLFEAGAAEILENDGPDAK